MIPNTTISQGKNGRGFSATKASDDWTTLLPFLTMFLMSWKETNSIRPGHRGFWSQRDLVTSIQYLCRLVTRPLSRSDFPQEIARFLREFEVISAWYRLVLFLFESRITLIKNILRITDPFLNRSNPYLFHRLQGFVSLHFKIPHNGSVFYPENLIGIFVARFEKNLVTKSIFTCVNFWLSIPNWSQRADNLWRFPHPLK